MKSSGALLETAGCEHIDDSHIFVHLPTDLPRDPESTLHSVLWPCTAHTGWPKQNLARNHCNFAHRIGFRFILQGQCDSERSFVR